MAKSFTVKSGDVSDRKKNPNLSLSVRDIEKNPKIPKDYHDEKLEKRLTRLGCDAIKGKFKDVEDFYCEGREGNYKFDSITNVNFKPHPFTIGVSHVVHASDHFNGMLGSEVIEDLERKAGPSCAFRGSDRRHCMVPFAEHTSDKVAFLKVKSDKELQKIKELGKFLLAGKEILTKEKIDGVGFVEWK